MVLSTSRAMEDTSVHVSDVMRTPGSPVFRTTVVTMDSGHSQMSLHRVEKTAEELFVNVYICTLKDCDLFCIKEMMDGGDRDRDTAEYYNHTAPLITAHCACIVCLIFSS